MTKEKPIKEMKISAIREGTVIDHIPSEAALGVAEILNVKENDNVVSIAFNLQSKKLKTKGIIKVGGKFITKEEADKIAVIAPKATVSIIKEYNIVKKTQVEVPDVLVNILKCSNPKCITNAEAVKTKFYVENKEPIKVRCHYCERTMKKDEIGIVSKG